MKILPANRIILEGQLFSTKNSKDIIKNKGRNSAKRPYFLISSKAAQVAMLPMELQLNSQRHVWEDAFYIYTCLCGVYGKDTLPLRLGMKIYRKTRARFDYNNITQGLFDMLVKARYLADDSADYLIPVYEPYEIDKERPRVEFWIEEPQHG